MKIAKYIIIWFTCATNGWCLYNGVMLLSGFDVPYQLNLTTLVLIVCEIILLAVIMIWSLMRKEN